MSHTSKNGKPPGDGSSLEMPQDEIGKRLRAMYAEVENEAIPLALIELLAKVVGDQIGLAQKTQQRRLRAATDNLHRIKKPVAIETTATGDDHFVLPPDLDLMGKARRLDVNLTVAER